MEYGCVKDVDVVDNEFEDGDSDGEVLGENTDRKADGDSINGEDLGDREGRCTGGEKWFLLRKFGEHLSNNRTDYY